MNVSEKMSAAHMGAADFRADQVEVGAAGGVQRQFSPQVQAGPQARDGQLHGAHLQGSQGHWLVMVLSVEVQKRTSAN